MNVHSSMMRNSKKVETTQIFQYIHTVEYYSAVKGNDVLIHATIWMNLENHSKVKEASHKRPHIG